MNTKILKFELFSLFFFTIITLVVFYYRDTLPDNYLSISSATSSYGFFSYYGTSFLSFINYYSGPWVFVPCVFFTACYVATFSKRADLVDIFNIFPLCLISLFTTFYLGPSFLGAGLHQFIEANFSAVTMFFIWLASTALFLFGVFRDEFFEKIKLMAMKISQCNRVEIREAVTAKLKLLNFKLKTKTDDDLVKNNAEKDAASSVLEYAGAEEKKSEILMVPIIEARKIGLGDNENKVNEGESEEEDDEVDEVSDDDEYVDESEISTFSHRGLKSDGYSDEKYYNLVKLVNHKKNETKFSQPEDKYFHDIIAIVQAKLGEFKIQGQIINVLKGPVVDTFEWVLGPGEKVSRLTSIAEDLSLALSGAPIRMVYPMKGRTTVGIEIPRNPRDFIFLDEIIVSKDFSNTTHQLPLAMGKDAFGDPVVVDLAAMPHMLVAGSTGAGKSVFINSVLVSLLIKKSPNQMKLILIDPKQLELALYARLPHLIMPVITEAKTAATALLWACQEMERRYSIMSEFGVRNIEGFNHKLKNAGPEIIDRIRKFYEYTNEEIYELPYIVVIVDEFADLILTQKGKEIETHICRLAAKARAAGIHLMLATQRPSVDVITGLIKSNFPTRVSFRVTSSTDSRTILNAMGAEKLLGKGDMLYKQGVDTTRIHSAFIEELEIESLTEKLSEMTPSFNPSVMEFLENGGEEETAAAVVARDGDSLNGGKDDKYDEAVRVVLEHRTASASLLQRRLGVGYNRAANLIEEMEQNGVVGPTQGSKPRKVLMGPESII